MTKGLLPDMELLKDPLKVLDDFTNVFRCLKVYIFWKFIQYTINWDKTQMLKKNFFGQNKHYKKCTLFSFASSNSWQFHFYFAIFIRAELRALAYKQFHFYFAIFIRAELRALAHLQFHFYFAIFIRAELRALTHLSFTFTSQFLYELNYELRIK